MPPAAGSFGPTLKRLRYLARLQQKQLARKLGITSQTIGRWEKGTRGPTKKTLRELVTLFQPIDEAATLRLVEARGTTMQELGFGHMATTATVSLRHAVDAILLAGAEASDVPAVHVRAIVGAAVRRAREMGLSLETIDQGLTPLAS